VFGQELAEGIPEIELQDLYFSRVYWNNRAEIIEDANKAHGEFPGSALVLKPDIAASIEIRTRTGIRLRRESSGLPG
jgi:hypothetical protein